MKRLISIATVALLLPVGVLSQENEAMVSVTQKDDGSRVVRSGTKAEVRDSYLILEQDIATGEMRSYIVTEAGRECPYDEGDEIEVRDLSGTSYSATVVERNDSPEWCLIEMKLAGGYFAQGGFFDFSISELGGNRAYYLSDELLAEMEAKRKEAE